MQEGKLTFRDIFDGDKLFEIPEYQRAFSWEKKQIEEYLEDLKNQPSEKPYFLGTFLFHEEDDNGDYKKINIVDGQQRLTTSIILIKSILDRLSKLKSPKKKAYRRYILDDDVYLLSTANNDDSFFQSYILENEKPSDFETNSQRRLWEAKKILKKHLSKLEKDEIETIFGKIEKSSVLVHSVKSKSDAAQVFELINDRGKRLSDLEAIKSFLMYKVGIALKNPDQNLRDIEGKFAKIYRKGEALENKIREEQILTYYSIGYLTWKGDEFRDPKELIKKLVNSKPLDSNLRSYVKKITTKLQETFDNVFEIINNTKKNQAIDDLFMLGRIANFYPILIKAYDYDETTNKEQFSEIAELAELFSFVSAIANKRADTGVKYFYELARDFKGDYNLLQESILKIFEENWWRISTQFKEYSDEIYYGEWITKYVLFKYENKLRVEQGFQKLTKDSYFESDSRLKLSIEHITAKRAKELEMTDEFKENHLDNIGNLVLDTVSSNSSKGNKEVEEKIKSYNLAPIISQLEINGIQDKIKKELGNQNEWDNLEFATKFIEYRKSEIKKFILEKWDYKKRKKTDHNKGAC